MFIKFNACCLRNPSPKLRKNLAVDRSICTCDCNIGVKPVYQDSKLIPE